MAQQYSMRFSCELYENNYRKINPWFTTQTWMKWGQKERDEGEDKHTEITTQKTSKMQKEQKTHKKWWIILLLFLLLRFFFHCVYVWVCYYCRRKKIQVNVFMVKLTCTRDSNERNDFCVELQFIISQSTGIYVFALARLTESILRYGVWYAFIRF